MTFDEYFSRGVPKVNAPNVFRTSDGQYVNDQDQPLRVINNSLSDNPAMWTYQDELGKIYTPKITTTVQNGYISDLGGKPNNDTPLYKKIQLHIFIRFMEPQKDGKRLCLTKQTRLSVSVELLAELANYIWEARWRNLDTEL